MTQAEKKYTKMQNSFGNYFPTLNIICQACIVPYCVVNYNQL